MKTITITTRARADIEEEWVFRVADDYTVDPDYEPLDLLDDLFDDETATMVSVTNDAESNNEEDREGVSVVVSEPGVPVLNADTVALARAIAQSATAIANGTLTGPLVGAAKLMLSNVETLVAWAEDAR